MLTLKLLSPEKDVIGISRAHATSAQATIARATWHLDEMVVKVNGRKPWLWRAVDQHGAVLRVLVQSRRDARAARASCTSFLKAGLRAQVADNR
jgi:putative transposase